MRRLASGEIRGGSGARWSRATRRRMAHRRPLAAGAVRRLHAGDRAVSEGGCAGEGGELAVELQPNVPEACGLRRSFAGGRLLATSRTSMPTAKLSWSAPLWSAAALAARSQRGARSGSRPHAQGHLSPRGRIEQGKCGKGVDAGDADIEQPLGEGCAGLIEQRRHAHAEHDQKGDQGGDEQGCAASPAFAIRRPNKSPMRRRRLIRKPKVGTALRRL